MCIHASIVSIFKSYLLLKKTDHTTYCSSQGCHRVTSSLPSSLCPFLNPVTLNPFTGGLNSCQEINKMNLDQQHQISHLRTSPKQKAI